MNRSIDLSISYIIKHSINVLEYRYILASVEWRNSYFAKLKDSIILRKNKLIFMQKQSRINRMFMFVFRK